MCVQERSQSRRCKPSSVVRDRALLGSDVFICPLLEQMDELKEIPRAQRLLHQPSLMALLTKAFQDDGAIRKAYFGYGYSMAAVARHVVVHDSTVSKVIKGERREA